MSGSGCRNALIQIRDGSSKIREYSLREGQSLLVGRHSTCDCRIDEDMHVSRRHLRLEWKDGELFVVELGTRNGTKINGDPMPVGGGHRRVDRVLSHEDVIQIGKCSLQVLLTPESASAEQRANDVTQRAGEDTAQVGSGEDTEPLAGPNKTVPTNGVLSVRADQNAVSEYEERREPRPASGAVPRDAASMIEQIMHGMRKDVGGQDAPSLPGYADMQFIGSGGFGAVFKARRVKDASVVAIKVMLLNRRDFPKDIARFEREREIALQLEHPNLVKTLDGGVLNNLQYIVMKYYPEGCLCALLKTTPGNKLPLAVAKPILLGVLDALAYLHEADVCVTTKNGLECSRGVIHRDIKPENVLLHRHHGRTEGVLSDMGLSKAPRLTGRTLGDISVGDGFCGSLECIAPEHITGYRYVELDTDVFEIAATFFYALTGKSVWNLGKKDTYRAIARKKPLRLQEELPDVDPKLALVFDRALQVDRHKRYRNARELLDAMGSVL